MGQSNLPFPNLIRAVVLGATLLTATGAQAQAPTNPEIQQSVALRVDGLAHPFDYFVPARDAKAAPMPLLVLLHGAGGDGRGQIQAWLPVARAKQCILLAPSIENTSKAWDALYDRPEWILDAIESISNAYSVDKRRLYLWGYSAGGMFAFYFGFVESRYFAAAAVHGGVIENARYAMADLAARKIPFAYYIGTRDAWWSSQQARASRDALLARGFGVHYVELEGADHNFFARSAEITADAWEFFTLHALEADARFDPLDRAKIQKAR
jgi:poly(3-hydroxybutyrate) depolymerase